MGDDSTKDAAPAPGTVPRAAVTAPPRKRVPTVRALFFLVLLTALIAIQFSGGSDGVFRPSRASVNQQLVDVVEAQLTAFRANDWPTAFTFATTAMQHRFNVKLFEQMVRQGYPLITQSVSASYGVAQDNGREAMLDVLIIGKKNITARFRYHFDRVGRSWKISGVEPQKN